MVVVERVTGTLEMVTESRSSTHWVLLDIRSTVNVLKDGTSMITLSSIELVGSHGVPDGGPYTLCFRHHGKQYETIGVQIQNGRFLSSNRWLI